MPEELRKALELLTAHKNDEAVKTELAKLVKPSTSEELYVALQGDENGKKLLDSYADKRVTTGVASAVENFKKKELPTFIADAVKKKEEELEKKYNPTKTEAEKKLEALEKETEELKRVNKLSTTRTALTTLFAEKNLNTAFMDLFVHEDTDAAVKKASDFAEAVTKEITTKVNGQVETLLKQHGYDPKQTDLTRNTGKITQQHLDAAADAARKSGTAEARANYSLLKQQFNLQEEK